MNLVILLIIISLLLFITYLYVHSWKKYISKAWQNGIKKGLSINKEIIIKEILKNNKKIIAIKIYYSILNPNYWKYTYLLNIESSALNYIINQCDIDIDSAINLKESEILNISDIFYEDNKNNMSILKDKNIHKEDMEIKSFILELKKGKII